MASELDTLTSIEQHGDLNPVQRTRLQELRAQNPTANTPVDYSNPQSAIQAAIKQQQEAVQPAIQSYQASIPEVQAKYAQTRSQLQSQQPSLEQRYSDLLASIKNQGQQDVNAQTRITSNELGKRGLTGSSTLAQQEIQNAVAPINFQYSNLGQQTSLAREDALRTLQDSIANLTPQETADTRSIQNAIASLQAGAGQTGAAQGMQLYSTNLQNQLEQQKLAEQQKQDALQNALAQLVQQQNYQNQQRQLDISQQNTGISGGNLALNQAQFAYQKQMNDPAYIQSLMNKIGIGVPNQSRYSIVP